MISRRRMIWLSGAVLLFFLVILIGRRSGHLLPKLSSDRPGFSARDIALMSVLLIVMLAGPASTIPRIRRIARRTVKLSLSLVTRYLRARSSERLNKVLIRSSRVVGLEPGDPRKIGRHKLRGRIGSGGMAAVYVVYHRGHLAALKSISSQYIRMTPDNPERIEVFERFKREILVMQRTPYPPGKGLPILYDYGPLDDPTWIKMEFIDAPTLSQYLDTHPKGIRLSEVLQMTDEIARILAAIHAAGYVHRDVKPGNVLRAKPYRLIDPGVAHAMLGRSLTLAGTRLGTVDYFSPEQVRNREIGPESDVFSLGCMVYEVITGQPPFYHRDLFQTMANIVQSHPPFEDVPELAKPLLRRCLAKHPADRPTAREVYLEADRLRRLIPARSKRTA